MTDTILVLGAGGFIGGHAVAAIRAAGMVPVAGVRRAGTGPAGVQARAVDATDRGSVEAAMDGVSAVLNATAGAPEAMLRAARAVMAAAGSRRVVHLSSMAVYGDATGTVAEDAPMTPVGDYGEGKAAAERAVRAHLAGGGDAVVLRPGIVHGPGSEGWTARPARLLRAGRLGDLGPVGDGVCNLTSAADLGAAIVAALRVEGARGGAFNVSDPAPGTWNDYFRDLAIAIGATPVRRLPGWRMRAEGLAAYPLKAAEIIGWKARVRTPDVIPPSLIRTFGQEIALDPTRADAVLGFPRTPPDRALADAAGWFVRGG